MRRATAILLVSIGLGASPLADAAAPPDTVMFTIRIGKNQLGSMLWTTRDAPDGIEGSTRTTLRVDRGTESLLCTQEIAWREDRRGDLERMSSVSTGMGVENWSDSVERIPGTGSWRRIRTRGDETIVDSLPGGALLGPGGFERACAKDRPDSLGIVAMLDPEQMRPDLYRIRLAGRDTLRLRDGSAVPCRILSVEDSSRSGTVERQWRDAKGGLWRELDLSIGLVSERVEVVPEDDAGRGSAGSAPARFDAARWLLVPIDGGCPAEGPCVLVLEPIAAEPNRPGGESPVPEGPGQTVSRGDTPGTWIVHLSPLPLPETGESDRAAWRRDPGLAGALRSGLFVDSDSPAIRAFADGAVSGVGGNPSVEAMVLERSVHDRIRLKDYSTVMGTASGTLARGQGDCTEHAILLAALCRARGIPARLVAGLTPQGGGTMAWHLWTEVWLGRWTPLDATLGRGAPAPGTVGLIWMERPEDQFGDLERPIGVLAAGYRFRVLEGNQ